MSRLTLAVTCLYAGKDRRKTPPSSPTPARRAVAAARRLNAESRNASPAAPASLEQCRLHGLVVVVEHGERLHLEARFSVFATDAGRRDVTVHDQPDSRALVKRLFQIVDRPARECSAASSLVAFNQGEIGHRRKAGLRRHVDVRRIHHHRVVTLPPERRPTRRRAAVPPRFASTDFAANSTSIPEAGAMRRRHRSLSRRFQSSTASPKWNSDFSFNMNPMLPVSESASTSRTRDPPSAPIVWPGGPPGCSRRSRAFPGRRSTTLPAPHASARFGAPLRQSFEQRSHGFGDGCERNSHAPRRRQRKIRSASSRGCSATTGIAAAASGMSSNARSSRDATSRKQILHPCFAAMGAMVPVRGYSPRGTLPRSPVPAMRSPVAARSPPVDTPPAAAIRSPRRGRRFRACRSEEPPNIRSAAPKER